MTLHFCGPSGLVPPSPEFIPPGKGFITKGPLNVFLHSIIPYHQLLPYLDGITGF
jgi:hypothetical protein